jgi:hypothetical protein
MILKNITLFASALSVAVIMTGCGSSADSDMIEGGETVTTDHGKESKAQNVFYSSPSPIETTSLLKAAGAKYNAKYLNPVENVSNYESVASKALNLGVYGSDLSFTSIYDQTQESLLYLRCTNKLAGSLGISGAFDEKTTSRIEANMENRDSLLAIISDSYWTADAFLKENGQPGVSALIIAGGWLEGLYIACQIANETKSEDIANRIGEQKLSLNNLVALLEEQKGNNAGISDVLDQMNGLKKIYDSIDVKTAETTVSTDKEKGMTTVGNDASFKMSPEQLAQITAKATEIRNHIIK